MIDVQIGHRIKALRGVRGLSQSALGKAIGVSFQQVQKYETGATPLRLAKLYAIALALDVDVQSFICDLAPAPRAAVDPQAAARTTFAASPEGVRLLDAFRALPAHPRRMTLAAIAALAACVRVAEEDGTRAESDAS